MFRGFFTNTVESQSITITVRGNCFTPQNLRVLHYNEMFLQLDVEAAKLRWVDVNGKVKLLTPKPFFHS